MIQATDRDEGRMVRRKGSYEVGRIDNVRLGYVFVTWAGHKYATGSAPEDLEWVDNEEKK